jgi:purine-nucleoside/S-methyl-5'-thioadenosine phosphorylase / adenosine deaminase
MRRVPRLPLTPHGIPPGYFTFSSLTEIGVVNATTTRHCAGIGTASASPSPFAGGAGELLTRAGLAMDRVAWGWQVHGADVAAVGAGGGFAGRVDVLVTTTPGVPLAIFTADCLAIVLVDIEAPALAVAHVGWRGTVRGAAQAAVAALLDAGARPERIRAVISPSIGPCCYEVDAPVIDQFAAAYPDRSRAWMTPSNNAGHVMLDLWSANAALLEEAGVSAARIENPRVCTACHTDTLYSYRKGHKGRLATLAALPA